MMADNTTPGPGSLLGGVPRNQLTGLSPYLNVDPSYLNSSKPEYLFNQEESRGRMENSFTAIGTSVVLGSISGCAYGLYHGVRSTAAMSGNTRRTQILNHTIKSGGSVSNALGTIAVIYSSLYAILSLAHEDDDELKSVVSGSLTGALYKSTSGIKKCGMGVAFGFGLASLWAFGLKKDSRVANYI